MKSMSLGESDIAFGSAWRLQMPTRHPAREPAFEQERPFFLARLRQDRSICSPVRLTPAFAGASLRAV